MIPAQDNAQAAPIQSRECEVKHGACIPPQHYQQIRLPYQGSSNDHAE
jgi:hypothetical protein